MNTCVFCPEPADRLNSLDEPVCEDHSLQHWHDHDGSMWDRHNPGSEWARRRADVDETAWYGPGGPGEFS